MISVLGLAVMGRPLAGASRPTRPTIPASWSSEPLSPPRPPAGARPRPAAAPAPDPLGLVRPRRAGTRAPRTWPWPWPPSPSQGNEPLYLSDTWGRTWGSATSDHYVGNTDAWAVDLAVRGIQRPTPQTEEAARRVAAALGHPDWTGGDLKVTIQGYRFQVLWKVAGHFNHVHVGVKKV